MWETIRNYNELNLQALWPRGQGFRSGVITVQGKQGRALGEKEEPLLTGADRSYKGRGKNSLVT